MKMIKVGHKVKLWLLVLMGIFILVGCRGGEIPILPGKVNTPVEEKEKPESFKTEGEKLQITATTKWVKDDSLHPESSLSLHSEEYNSYLIVLEDKKGDFPMEMELSYYSNLISENLKNDLTEGEISEVKDMEVSGQNGKLFKVSGKEGEVPLTYLFLITEKDDTFYQVILWSSTENIENNSVYYEDIITSPEFIGVSSAS